MPIKGIANASRNSVSGLRDAWGERAFRLEAIAAALLVPIAVCLPVTPVEKALLGATVLLVLLVELLNSAVEAAVDRISLERHELSRRAKDLGSAAVMVALLLCAFVWAAVLLPLVA